MTPTGLPAQVAALTKDVAELRKRHDDDAAMVSEALAGILAKLDELIELVTKRTAPP